MGRTFKLMIAGASVRWLAEFAAKLDCDVFAADLFSDIDTRKVAKSFHLDRFSSLPAIVKNVRPDALILSGGLESNPSIVRQTRQNTNVLTADARQLLRCNDPNELSSVFGEQFPESCYQLSETANPELWLQKNRNSSGGLGIRNCSRQTERTPSNPTHFFQQKVAGKFFGASFLATENQVVFLGACRQQFGPNADCKRPYLYSGSVGPVNFDPDPRKTLARWGIVAANEFELRGLFGIDFVQTDDFELKIIEINPRPTASMEIINISALTTMDDARAERDIPTSSAFTGAPQSHPFNLVQQHLRSYGIEVGLKDQSGSRSQHAIPDGNPNTLAANTGQTYGKSVFFNTRDFPILLTERLMGFLNTPQANFRFADLGREGTEIGVGHPIVSLIARAPNVEALSHVVATARKDFWNHVDTS